MSIALDDVGDGNQGLSASSLTVTGIVPNNGDCVVAFVIWSTNTGVTMTGATWDPSGANAAMTQVGSSFSVGTNSGFACFMAAYKIEGVSGDGSTSKSITFTPSAAAVGIKGNGEAFSGVGSVGTTLYTASAASTAPLVSVTSATGHVAVNAIANFGAAASIPSYTQTADWNTATDFGMAMGHAAGSSSVSFGATISGSKLWGAVGFDLLPPGGTTISPPGASIATTDGTASVSAPREVDPSTVTISTTVGTPDVEIAAGAPIQPGAATGTLTLGTPSASAPFMASPTGAPTTASGGTPIIDPSPVAAMLAKLVAGTDITIQGVGDSTMWGWADGLYSTMYGWLGRFAIGLGKYYNAHVKIKALAYPSGFPYSALVTLYTAVGSGRPTITVYNGGYPGALIANYLADLTDWLPVSNPDLVIIQDGFNETSTSTFTSNYATLISDIQNTYCPGAPIIVTTGNATTATQISGHTPTFAQIWAAEVTEFISGASLPLSPSLQASTSTNNLWVLDTQQAFPTDPTVLATYLYGSDTGLIPSGSRLHPIAPGYDLQANWMLGVLAPAAVPALTIDPSTATGTLTAGTAGVTAPFVDSPSTASGSVTAGTPTVSVVDQTLIEAATSTVATIDGTPSVSAPYVDSPTSATGTLTPGTPSVSNPELLNPSGGSIDTTQGTPDVTAPLIESPGTSHIITSTGIPGVGEVGSNEADPGGGNITATPGTPSVILTTGPSTDTPLSPYHWLREVTEQYDLFEAVMFHGFNENTLDRTLAPDLYTAVQNVREIAKPMHDALVTAMLKYTKPSRGDEFWERYF